MIGACACTETIGRISRCECAQVLGSLLLSVWMAGQKMLVVAKVIRLRNRRAELTSVLAHMRAATTARELAPVRVSGNIPWRPELETAISFA